MFQKAKNSDSIVEIKGETWNRMIVLLENLESRLLTTSREQRDPKAVRVQNETGADIDPHSIVRIGEPLTKPGDVAQDLGYQFQHSFKGESTNENTVDFGIAVEGIPNDIGGGTKGVGIIKTHGICTASVNVIDAGHGYAKPSATDGQLESTSSGTSVRILFSSGAGVQKCKIMFVGLDPHVRLEQVGGVAGDDTQDCSFTYNAFEIGSTTPIQGSPFSADLQLTYREPLTKLAAAKFGHLFGDKLQVIELPDGGGC